MGPLRAGVQAGVRAAGPLSANAPVDADAVTVARTRAEVALDPPRLVAPPLAAAWWSSPPTSARLLPDRRPLFAWGHAWDCFRARLLPPAKV